MYSRHLIIEQGGTRALVTGMGATLALKVAGLKDWSTIGGISGGSIPAILMAAGLNPLTALEGVMACDFAKLFQPTTKGSADPAAAFAAVKEGERAPAHKFMARMLRKGMMHTDKLGELIEEQVKVWPESFWTMASSEHSHVFFTSERVVEYGFDGSITVMSDEPAPISTAIRATCAVPVLMEAIEFRGRYLFDGALTPYGGNPVAFARKHLLGEEGMVITCHSSGRDSRKNDILMSLGRWLLCHSSSKVKTDDHCADININPHVPQLNALRFNMTEMQKQLGMLAGFNATVSALTKHSSMFQEGVRNLSSVTDFNTLLHLVRHCIG